MNKNIIIEEEIKGNFIIGIGSEITDYTNNWIFGKNNHIHFKTNEIGDKLYCVALENLDDIITSNIQCQFLYDSKIMCNLNIYERDIEIIATCNDKDNNIWESWENKIEDEIKKNNTLNFEITMKNIKKGDCLFMIEFNCTTQKTKQSKISIQDFYKEYLLNK